jgi:hypothetical protein
LTSEAGDAQQLTDHAPHTLCYHRTVRDLASLLDCEPTLEAVLASRQALGWEPLTRLCIDGARLAATLLDDGYPRECAMPLSWHRNFVPTHRLLRLETLAEAICQGGAAAAGAPPAFPAFIDRFRAEVEQQLPQLAGLKSILAYRGGFVTQAVDAGDAAARYAVWIAQPAPCRLNDAHLAAFLLERAVEVAARHEVPVQLHCGFGDGDLRLDHADPSRLRWLFEPPRLRAAPIVLLHAAWPYVRQAAWLASIYPQVHVDFGLAIPMLSRQGMRHTLTELLTLAPYTKLLYSSDASRCPELFFLAAKWARLVLGEVLQKAVLEHDLDANEAYNAAVCMLSDNAHRLYNRVLSS